MRQNDTFGVLFLTLHPASYEWRFVPEAGETFTDSGSGAVPRPGCRASPHHRRRKRKAPVLGPCTIRGTDEDDRLVGTRKRDVICGLGGNDMIRGLGGNDVIRGGSGNDRLRRRQGQRPPLRRRRATTACPGQSGRDRLVGGTGRDRLYGDRGNDSLSARDTRRSTACSAARGRDRAKVDRARPRALGRARLPPLARRCSAGLDGPPVSPASALARLQVLEHLSHDDRSLAHGGRHPLDRVVAQVADGEHPGHARLERLEPVRRLREATRKLRLDRVRAGLHVAASVTLDVLGKPVGVRACADQDEEGRGGDVVRRARLLFRSTRCCSRPSPATPDHLRAAHRM